MTDWFSTIHISRPTGIDIQSMGFGEKWWTEVWDLAKRFEVFSCKIWELGARFNLRVAHHWQMHETHSVGCRWQWVGPVFIPRTFLGDTHPQTYNFLPERMRNCALYIFFSGRDDELQLCITQNSLLVDNKHRKLFVIQQPKGCKFMPKCTKIHLTVGLHPDLLGRGVYAI